MISQITARRDKPSQPCQVHGGFGLSGAHQHSALARPQRKHMAGPRQVRRPGSGIDRNFDGARPIVGGDSGGHAIAGVNRFAEGSPVVRGVLRRHRPDAQMIQPLLGHGQADQAASVFGHEIDGFRRDLLRRQRQVAFVFTVFVVHHHHHPPGADFLDRGRAHQ